MSDESRLAAIKERVEALSNIPEWTAYRMVHEDTGELLTPEQLGEYVKNAVKVSAAVSGSHEFLFVSVETPNGPRDVCHVGNGPQSPVNAQFIAHARSDVPYLLDLLASQVEVIQQLRSVIERLIASGYLPEKCEHAAEPDYCDSCRFQMEKAQQMARIHARAALEAFPAPPAAIPHTVPASSPAPGQET